MELYEKKLLEKSKQDNTEITRTLIKASLEDSDLRIFTAEGLIKAETIQKITEEQLPERIKQKSLRQENGENMYLVDEATKKVAMKMHLLEALDRVWTLHQDYLSTLEAMGYGKLTQTAAYGYKTHTE